MYLAPEQLEGIAGTLRLLRPSDDYRFRPASEGQITSVEKKEEKL